MLGVGRGEDLEGRPIGPIGLDVRRAARVAHDGGEFGQQGREAVRLPEVQRLRQDFGLEWMMMIGDRGMISQ